MKKIKKNKRLVAISLLCFFAVAGFYAQNSKALTAPDIELHTLDNQRFNLKQLRGKVVLINFWATNCASCLKEIPHLKTWHQDYHAQGLDIIAVNMFYDRPNHVVQAVKNFALPYKIVLDLKQHIAKAFGDVQFTPTTFLIDTQGNIVFHHTGLLNADKMNTLIKQHLPTP